MPRVSDARHKLIEAATDLIWRSSYASTSVDAICEGAGVKKGSFYHFFESKEALAMAAIDENWALRKVEMDRCFSPLVQPLDRFRLCHDLSMGVQTQMKTRTGHVCGCPLVTLGCEIGTHDGELRSKVQEIMEEMLKYFESAIRDAVAQNQIPATDPFAKARMVQNYLHGCLTQGRIANSLEPLQEILSGIYEILGAVVTMPKSA
jgi:TetR/AcrR family transcriptional repressor of nem operon